MSAEDTRRALADDSLAAALARYIPEYTRHHRENLRRQLDTQRFVMPVFGVQGSGKSTLLTALLFDEPVFPIDADETTCVPVEVHYEASAPPEAQVYFSDGRTERCACTETALRRYVHQAENRGNRLGVDRIVLKCHDSLLRHGLVLVDLPGVGSLTEANQKTTERYLEEAVSVLVMLRTVPPITRSEANGIVAQWARLPTAMFVQNRFSDESDEEVADAVAHNVETLSQLARRCRIPDAGPPNVHVVSAEAAKNARFCAERAELDTLGILALRAALGDASAAWPRLIEKNVRGQCLGTIDDALRELDRRIDETNLSRAAALALIGEEEKRFTEYDRDLARQLQDCSTRIDGYVEERRAALAAWSHETKPDLRNKIRTRIRAGIVDGPRLGRAAAEEFRDADDHAMAEFQEATLAIIGEMRERFAKTVVWGGAPSSPGVRLRLAARTKFESVAPTVLGSLGGLGGGAGGAALVGAIVGSAGGPLGTYLGAAVGTVIGGLLGHWLGGKAEAFVTSACGKDVEPIVFGAIESAVDQTRARLEAEAERVAKDLKQSMEVFREVQKAEFEGRRRTAMNAIGATVEERERTRRELEDDSRVLTAWRGRMDTGAA